MRIIKRISRSAIVIAVVCGCLLPLFQAAAVDSNTQVPAVIQNGFDMWAKKGTASWAVDVWRVGGLMENNSKPATQSNYFSRIDRTVGNYKSYEVIDTKPVGQSSEIIYIAIKFERVAIYARFLMYRTEKDWVVQNMDFSPNPEAVMPWLAFAGGNYTE